MVNDDQANGTHIVDEKKEVNISCFFSNGNPPVNISMLDDNGNTLSSSSDREGYLVLSREFRCHDVWPNPLSSPWFGTEQIHVHSCEM